MSSSRILSAAAGFVVIAIAASMCLADITGGMSPVDTSDSLIQDLACWAVAKIDETTTSADQQALVGIVSGTQQVVAGVLYQLTILVMQTACKKNADCSQLCMIQDCDAAPKVCQVTIWDKPWLNERVLTSTTC